MQTTREQRNSHVRGKNYVWGLLAGAALNTSCIQDGIVPYICGTYIRASYDRKYLVETKQQNPLQNRKNSMLTYQHTLQTGHFHISLDSNNFSLLKTIKI